MKMFRFLAVLVLLALGSPAAFAVTDITETVLAAASPKIYLVGPADAPYTVSTLGTGGTCTVAMTAAKAPLGTPAAIYKNWDAGAVATANTEILFSPATAIKLTVGGTSCVIQIRGSN
jgi:hypothetical protein